ncbi:glycosyltransferase domain-containing protein [Ekhidna sp.]|jgi:hypothetical protein|uniref:glycosyltransferase domain-containing protein n=1 Tax=Ekhidna sp. TaxID=2608089 RepID=UPI0032EF78EF
MKVVTVATHHNHHLERLLVSARKQGIEVELIGEGREYIDHYIKTDWLIEYLETVDKDEIILYTDGYDSVLLQDESYIKEAFEKINHPMVFGAEQNFNCEASFFKKIDFYLKFPKGKRPYRFLNAGGWIGRAGYAKELLTKVVGGDDQSLLLKYVSKHKTSIKHDTDQKIFAVMAGRTGMEDHDYRIDENGKVQSTITGSNPAILHAPGKNYYGLYKIISQLKFFPKETSTEEEIKQYKKSQFWNSLTAKTTADNYLFHLLLKVFVGTISIALIVGLLSYLS